jgi:hypothetical protein
MNAVVLTYHAMNVSSNDYAGNDHVAFREDLNTITSSGWTIVPLRDVVAAFFGEAQLPPRALAISFDDGADFDARDIVHPVWGMQRSMLGVMEDFQRDHPGRQARLHATSFVIVSPTARAALDRSCMIGAGWWNDNWWQPATASGLMDIANHSWDHNHDALPAELAPRSAKRGTFLSVDNRADADYQLRTSCDYLRRQGMSRGAALFAYPYGDVSAYLRDAYFPDAALNPGVTAAFSTAGGPITQHTSRWALPRNVCGDHWRSPEELVKLLGRCE